MFNYYLPGKTREQVAPGDKLEADLLRTAGLLTADGGGVLADCTRVPAHASVLEVQRGPDGKAGTVIAPVRKHSGEPGCFYSPTLQTWSPVRPGQLWIGYEHSVPFSPRLLERWNLVGGAEVSDEQGHVWIVPIARAPHYEHPFGTLPQAFTFDPATGEPVPHLLAKFTWLWELAGEIREWYLAAAGPGSEATPEDKATAPAARPFADLVRYAARILSVNYRIGQAELTVLFGLGTAVLTQETVHAICQATYGYEVLDLAKKNAPASAAAVAPSSSLSPIGDKTPAASPATAPAAGL